MIPTIIIMVISGRNWADASPQVSERLSTHLASLNDAATVPAWIFFRDKGPEASLQLAAVEAALTEKARQRRLKHQKANSPYLVDRHDIPVYGNYIRTLRPHVSKIRKKSRWLNAISVELNRANLQALQQFNFIRRIDLVIALKKDLPVFEAPAENTHNEQTFGKGSSLLNYGPSLNQNSQINVVPLHDLGFNGSGILIAMLDSGYDDMNHVAMDHFNIVATWDFVNGDSVITNQSGQLGNHNHGFLTLSAIGGFQDGSLIGPAYGASYLLAKTEIVEFERNIEEDNWVAGAEWADSLGADIINSSLGYNDFDPGQTSYSWQDLDGNTAIVTIGADIAASRGILVVNSAGNSGPSSPPANTLGAPADGDSVLTVGAVTSGGSRSSFSSTGPTADGRIKPDVMAQGSAVYLASSFNPNGYRTANGTSFSSPLTAGAAALIMQVNPGWTNMQVIEALRTTANNAANPNNFNGWGIVDANAAANLVLVGTGEAPATLPASISLYNAYPNPFNPSTTIRYTLPQSQQITLQVFNVMGQAVAILHEGRQAAGEHRTVWNAGNLTSGIYYIVLKSANASVVQKAVLMK